MQRAAEIKAVSACDASERSCEPFDLFCLLCVYFNVSECVCKLGNNVCIVNIRAVYWLYRQSFEVIDYSKRFFNFFFDWVVN